MVLTGEMMELIHDGVNNIVCIQPLDACRTTSSERVSSRKFAVSFPKSNIVAIDYTPAPAK